VVAEGDRVAISWGATGTHTGPLMGMPPTGKAVHVLGCNILHIEAGHIVEHWAYFDRMALMAQLGAGPA
jgi:predicted ester cyclase